MMIKFVFFCLILFSTHLFGSDQEEVNASEAQPRPKTDTLTVEGAVLQGRVTSLTAEGVSFSLIYGRGTILIPFESIEQLTTEHQYHIFYRGKESVGKIVSIHDNRWLVVQDGNKQELIDVDDIERFILSVRDDYSFTNRLHNAFPFWSGNMDFGLQLEVGSVQKRQIDVAVRFEYNRLDHRVVLLGSREFDTQKPPDENWSTSKDEYLFNVEDDYYLSREKEEFLFVTSGFERDAVRQIENRIYPAGGLGYKRTFSKDFWLNLQIGLGGVFDRYTTYGQENYFAGYTGAETMYQFPHGSVLRAKVMYMPSLFHFRFAWLFRTAVSLTVPVTDMFALKMSFADVDDNNPSPDIGNNKTTTNFALSFTF